MYWKQKQKHRSKTKMNRSTFEGKVTSAKHSDYLTDRFGDEQEGIKGYTLHILIDKINAEQITKHCLELQCYADFCIETEKDGITYLNLVKPIYEVDGVPVTKGDVAIGESRICLKGKGFIRKIKHEKQYRMLRTGLPLCTIKQPLITDIILPEENYFFAKSKGVMPLYLL